MSEAKEIDLNELIETVEQQGCVELQNGEQGIPRKIVIDAEYVTVTVSTEKGTDDYELSELKRIVFVG